jgi:N,N'-diacetyllegionaminate synthase
MYEKWLEKDRCFVIAELGVNHNGSLEMAVELIDVARKAGADAVKFQTFFAEDLVSKQARKAKYQTENDPTQESQFEMLKRLELPHENWEEIRRYCQKSGIEFLSTPFGERAADLLQNLDVGAYKVSSGDLTHLPFLRNLAKRERPILLSSGMGNLQEVAEAVEAITNCGNDQIGVLHCVSCYPSAPEDSNLRSMATMEQAFQLPIGWSDHTQGETIGLAAVAMGAKIIEKHFTLSRDLPGPDHKASLEPNELANFVESIRMVDDAKGSGVKKPTLAEQETATVARRSLVVSKEVKVGEILTKANLSVVRPQGDVPPKYYDVFLGKKTNRTIAAGTTVTWDMIG